MVDRRLSRFVRGHRTLAALLLACVLMGGLLTVAQASLLSYLIDRAFLQGAPLKAMGNAMAGLVGVVLARAVVSLLGDISAGELSIRVQSDVRKALVDHLLCLGPAYARGQRTGELAVTAVEGVDRLDGYVRLYLPQLAAAALVPVLILAAVLPIDLLSGVLLVVTAPLLPVFTILIGAAADTLARRQYGLLSRLGAHFLDVMQGLKTLKLLGRSREQARVIARVGREYRRATLSLLRVAFLSAFAVETAATVSVALVAVQIGLRLLKGGIGFFEALLVLVLAPEFYLPLRTLGSRFHARASGLSAADRIFQVLQTAPAIRSGGRREGGGDGVAVRDELVLREVRYEYERGRTALRGVSFTVAAGSCVALVGPTGAGKSTIMALLLRFLEPQSGEILVDGRRLQEIDPEMWRVGVAWVPQTPALFRGTLVDNLRLARPGASMEQIIHAARNAQLHDWVTSLPQGYETQIGEGGLGVSGGQAQRLAVARAFLKDAPLLLLDEPTSQVDPDLEASLREATERLMQGRTTLIIAHRLNTVHRADQIVVLSGGRVVEVGTHHELWQAGGLYARLLRPYAETA